MEKNRQNKKIHAEIVATEASENQMGKRVITLNKGRLVSDERKGGSDRED